MLFSKFHQPKPSRRRGGRKPSAATIAKREQKAREERQREQIAFDNFLNADSGIFDGFDFVNLFHQKHNKSEAIYIGYSNDSADVVTDFGTFHAGADDVAAYFYSKNPTKMVRFNRSVYFI